MRQIVRFLAENWGWIVFWGVLVLILALDVALNEPHSSEVYFYTELR